jgi:hypothetical protein
VPPAIRRPPIPSHGFGRESGNAIVAAGIAGAVSFARLFIAQPDLLSRFALGHGLATGGPRTHCQGGGLRLQPITRSGPAPRVNSSAGLGQTSREQFLGSAPPGNRGNRRRAGRRRGPRQCVIFITIMTTQKGHRNAFCKRPGCALLGVPGAAGYGRPITAKRAGQRWDFQLNPRTAADRAAPSHRTSERHRLFHPPHRRAINPGNTDFFTHL